MLFSEQKGEIYDLSGSFRAAQEYPQIHSAARGRGKGAGNDRGGDAGAVLEKFADDALLRCDGALPAFNQRNTENAPVLIVSTFVTCVSGYDVKAGEPSNELGNGWGAYDCGLHDMALLLKASELGLSTLVMGIRDAEKLREVLSVPADEQIVSVIAVGYAAVDPDRPARKELTEIAKFFH